MTQQTVQNRLLKDIITGIAVSILIFAVTVYIPVLGFFLAFLLPMPVLLYRLKLGRKPAAVIMAAVFSIIAAVTGGMYVDLLFYGSLLITGFFLGEYIEMPLSIEKTGLYTGLTTIGICTLVLFLYAVVTGQNIISIVSEYVAKNIEITLQLYSEMGVPEENIEIISSSIDTVQYILVRILPALIATMLMFGIWINLLFIKLILVKKKITIARLEKLNQWRAPEKLVWLAIIFGLLLIFPVQALKITGLNLIIVLMPIYFFQGIAIVSYFFEKKRFPVVLKFFLYSILAIQQILLLLIMGLGFFDTWINFRRLDTMEDSEQ